VIYLAASAFDLSRTVIHFGVFPAFLIHPGRALTVPIVDLALHL
jgi:hypothetical protein